jgi:PKD repeat protein
LVSVTDTTKTTNHTWSFGDSSSSVSSYQSNITHTYSKPGTYNVCLYTKTITGCESKICNTIVVGDSINRTPGPPTSCKAQFTYTLSGDTLKLNSAGSVAASSTDSIISRTWYFSDSTNASNTTPIKPPVPTSCKAGFTYTIQGYSVKLNSATSVPATSADSITSRTWYFSDSTTANSVITGNIVDPTHVFAKPGTYTVYLAITTKLGCSSKYSTTITIKDTVPTNCKAVFIYTVQASTVAFNSSASTASSSTDSIISRYWIFGDSTSLTTGVNANNIINPSYTYAKAGTYQVLLYTKTSQGCESRYAATVTISTTAFHCEAVASFTTEHISLKKIQFNSSLSKAQLGDSIISRNWNFGDSTVLTGNEISPAKEYTTAGYYNACLQINTAKGCVSKVCKELTILDSVTTPQSNIEYIKIISINPNPVVSNMYLTVWSRNSNAETEISVFDIYGTSRFTIKKILIQGNNIIQVNTESLMHGPYFIKVSTKNGKDSKQFYKL